MIFYNKKIENMNINDILQNIKIFIEENNINFEISFSYDSSIMNYDNHFVKFYDYKGSCFGNLKIDGFDLNSNLNLYKKIVSSRGINDGIYLNKRNLVELLDDILTINNIKNLDPNKIILGKKNIKKEFKEVIEEKIIKINELDEKNLNIIRNYLITRGINNLNDEFLRKNFKYIKTDEENEYIMMKTIYHNVFDGYKLLKMEKSKLGFNALTFINNKTDEVYITEGKLDTFEIMKKLKNNVNYIINNGIHINKKLIEILNLHKTKNFIIDKDIRGIVFFLDSIKLLTKKEKEIDNIFMELNKKLLLIIKQFSETTKFKNLYKLYDEVRKLSPLKRKKHEFYLIFQKLQNNPYFNNFNTTKGFYIDIDNINNKIFDTYELIKFFEDIFELNKNELFPDKIIKSSLNKIKNIDKNINYFIPDNENKDFNERNFKFIKLIEAYITNNKTILDKYNLLQYNIDFTILDKNKEFLLSLKEKNKEKFIETLLTNEQYKQYYKLKNIPIKYNFVPDLKKIDIELNKNINYFTYGIDETNIGGSIGSIFISMVYADKDRIKKYLISKINNNFSMKDFLSRNKKIKELLLEIDKNLNNKNLLSLLNKVFYNIKDNNIKKDILKPYYDLYLFESITDSKKLNDKIMFEINNLLKELQNNFLTRIRTIKYKVKNHSHIKELQKKGFVELVNGLPVIDEKMKNNLKKMIQESNNNPLKKELLEKIITEKKEIIIDGEKIIDIPTKHKIKFEPGADSKYFSVSCASIVARVEQLNELSIIIDKLKKFSEPKLENLIKTIESSKGYMTPNHKEILTNTVKNIDNKNILKYLKEIYRINNSTKEILFKNSFSNINQDNLIVK